MWLLIFGCEFIFSGGYIVSCGNLQSLEYRSIPDWFCLVLPGVLWVLLA